MVRGPHAQETYSLRFEWGPTGAASVAGGNGVLVIVDVLSFTTAVTVAVQRGTAVYPAVRRDAQAAALARRMGAVLAAGRREVTADHPWSLSPAALLRAPAPPRLVLPSPNGSAIAAASGATGSTGRTVIAACLRNARAVARWLLQRALPAQDPVTVLAAGERWPDGSLRPALEDLLGAAAVIDALATAGVRDLSPEAAAARAALLGTASVPDAVRRCASGVELIRDGFGADVEAAIERDVDDVVPLLTDGAFRATVG